MSAYDALREIQLSAPYELDFWWADPRLLHWRILARLRDVETGRISVQRGPIHEAWLEGVPVGQLVREVFGAYLAFVEHEARETFLYRGARVFGPHLDIDALVEVANRVDAA